MDSILQEVIQADQKAQERVAAIRKEKGNVRRVVEGQKDAIEKRYQEEAAMRMEAHKKRLQEEIKHVSKEKKQAYEQALRQLHETFENKKAEWISSIVQRCLDS